MTPDTEARPWFMLTAQEAFEALRSHRPGLTDEEAGARRLQYGPNELQRRRKTSPLIAFLKQFMSPLIYVLLAAGVVTLAVREYLDAAVIFVVLLANAIIGYVQESRAEAAMEALLQMAAPQAKVRRGGTVRLIPARDIVPGDVIILESGDKVPADALLIEVSELRVNEAVLTGESMPVTKHSNPLRKDVPLAERKNMVHMGTIVSFGRATALVVATGMSTEMGKIARAIREVEVEKTPLQKSIDRLSKFLVVTLLAVCALLVIVGLLQKLPALDIFLVAVAAAVSAIPEGLPAVVTVVLAIGMRTMARRNAIIRRLMAVESLGSATVICTDKTGTLTENRMTVRRIVVDGKVIEVTGEAGELTGEFRVDGRPVKPEEVPSLPTLLRIGALCNDAMLSVGEDKSVCILGDPTEGALVAVAAKASLDKEKLQAASPRVDEIPFQTENLYMVTLHPQDGKRVAYVKGATERILSLSSHYLYNGQVIPLGEDHSRAIREANQAMAAEAIRVIAMAYMELPVDTVELDYVDFRGHLVFVGLVGMDDPPRQEAIKAIAQCREAGIKVIMITGDNSLTAASVARQLGMQPGKIILGAELAGMSDTELEQVVEDVSIFARVEPLHKLRIVNALKKRGHVVAMTGDGVNDAPALRAASIGVAMGITGTDVAKEASDMVLADDNFASIVAAVEEGRAIFTGLRNVLFFLLSTNIGELLVLLLSLIFIGKAPLLAVQIIWANLMTDTAVGLPLGFEPKVGDELKQPPRHPRVGLLYGGLIMRIAFLAAMMSLGVFAIFAWSYRGDAGHLAKAQTMAFCALVAFQWFSAFNARSDEHTVLRLGLFRNRYLLLCIAVAVALQMAVVYVPFLQEAFGTVGLGVWDWAVIFGAAAALFLAEEARKIIAPRLFSRGKWTPA
ncbi:MAG: HAD-IC family P-type ATPase [Dehalococcoidia bacterium]|nr:HAD-IC family P-type ATPase [Dehalococcoidia bacterium]